VQTFAVALAVYATDPTLGGGAAASGQGFTIQTGGTGADGYNVGSNGAAFGVPNNAVLTVSQVLQILNNNYNPTPSSTVGIGTTAPIRKPSRPTNTTSSPSSHTNWVTLSDWAKMPRRRRQ